jgi:hypothetical protein
VVKTFDSNGAVVTEAKPQSGRERRMVLRLLEFWREAKGEAEFPRPAQLDAGAMPELFPFCMVLDITGSETDPTVVEVGRTMASYAATSLRGKRISELEPNTLAAQAVAYVAEVLRKGVPISRGGSFVDARGVTNLYRSIVLPLAKDGTTPSALIAAANCREVASA